MKNIFSLVFGVFLFSGSAFAGNTGDFTSKCGEKVLKVNYVDQINSVDDGKLKKLTLADLENDPIEREAFLQSHTYIEKRTERTEVYDVYYTFLDYFGGYCESEYVTKKIKNSDDCEILITKVIYCD